MRRSLRLMSDYAGFAVALFAYFCALYTPVLWSLEFNLTFKILVFSLFFVLYLGSIIVILVRVFEFDRYTESVSKLLILYFELLFIFASIYLWLYLLGGVNQIEGFGPLDREMLSSKEAFDVKLYKEQVWVIIVDSFHFSVVTGTTLGYGDMLPKHVISKLLVDLQVLLTVGVVVLGYGRYTNEHNKRN